MTSMSYSDSADGYMFQTNRCLNSAGIGCPLSRMPVQCGLPAIPSHFPPAAFTLAPVSLAKMYVMTFRYPISLAILTQAPYSFEQAFLVPSVHTRLISSVYPSSSFLATGLPQTATPHSFPPSSTPMQNLHPTVALWCLWWAFTYSEAALSVIGTMFMSLPRKCVDQS